MWILAWTTSSARTPCGRWSLDRLRDEYGKIAGFAGRTLDIEFDLPSYGDAEIGPLGLLCPNCGECNYSLYSFLRYNALHSTPLPSL